MEDGVACARHAAATYLTLPYLIFCSLSLIRSSASCEVRYFAIRDEPTLSLVRLDAKTLRRYPVRVRLKCLNGMANYT